MHEFFLNHIFIKNFRAYKEFECEFTDGVNLVIGDNGAGKTSLLKAIAYLLSSQLNDIGGRIHIDSVDPHVEVEKAGDSTLDIKENFPVELSGEIKNRDDIVNDFTVIYEDYTRSRLKGNIGLTKENGSNWSLISYQKFDRDWKLGKNTSKTIEVETGLNERRDGYKDCLSGMGQEQNIQKWCLKMSMLEFERRNTVKEFERFKYIIKTFLQAIEDDEEEFEVSYSTGFSGLVMRKGEQVQPLYELSTGYKALLSMIMELAYRSVLLNPDKSIDDDSQAGIVIIDEIDAHLHPKWQWRVIDALRKCFPKVQFIIATHSPIVIASAKDARLIDLGEKGEVFYSDGAYGYNVSDVLELKQGSRAMSRISKEYMDKLEEALDEGNLTEANRIAAAAKAEFGKDSPVYKELKGYLEVNRWVEDN